MAKIISEVKLFALLIQAYDAGRKSGKLDEYSQAYSKDADGEEAKSREEICLALVEQASIQGTKMIIVLGQNQAFPEAFAAWLRARGHTVGICPDEPESFAVDGDCNSMEDLFSVYSDGEHFHDESTW